MLFSEMNLNSETSIDRANLDIPVYNAFYADFSSNKKTKEGDCIFKGCIFELSVKNFEHQFSSLFK